MSAACRVLVVDDDPDLLDVVRLILEDEGCEVHTAQDGQRALDALRAGLEPDVILLDLRMPVMDGWTFETERRKADLARSAALVIISSEPVSVAAQLAPAEIQRKPLDVEAILHTTRLHCGHRVPPNGSPAAGR
jgi:two-component system chemotaxis response regulator CheY